MSVDQRDFYAVFIPFHRIRFASGASPFERHSHTGPFPSAAALPRACLEARNMRACLRSSRVTSNLHDMENNSIMCEGLMLPLLQGATATYIYQG